MEEIYKKHFWNVILSLIFLMLIYDNLDSIIYTFEILFHMCLHFFMKPFVLGISLFLFIIYISESKEVDIY